MRRVLPIELDLGLSLSSSSSTISVVVIGGSIDIGPTLIARLRFLSCLLVATLAIPLTDRKLVVVFIT